LRSLAPRSTPRRCSPGEYQTLLEYHRRAVTALVTLAIARDWDTGRIAFSPRDRPPFEAEVLAIAGRCTGLATTRVQEASEAAEQALDELRRMRSRLAGMSALDAICAEHGISTTGELILMHLAAPTLWGELTRLYGILANDPARSGCDEHLLWQLLRDSVTRRELSRELDPDGPLVAQGLVRTGDRARPFQPLTVDPIVIKLLAGSDRIDDGVRGVARVPMAISLDRFLAPRAVIDRALADLEVAPPGAARIVVRGRAGSGRRTLLAGLAQLAGRTLATIDATMLIREKRITSLADLLQHANLRGWLPCVDGLDTMASDDVVTRGVVREQLRDHPGPLALRLPQHAHPPMEPGYVLIELPTSTVTERADQWIEALSERDLQVRDPDSLAARFTVGAGTIYRIVETVARAAPADVDKAIDDTMRQHLETKLGEVATRVTRLSNWSQIVLPADIQDSIVELIARVRHRGMVYDTWGFDEVMATSRGLTALFQGGPGTGKTLVAGAIANELGLDLYRIDLSRVMSKWIGETEQNLAKVFDAAEEGQALILFDEADSLFAKRTEVRTSVDRYANLEVNYLLQRLDTFEGVAILTTNHGTSIDAAFKRRLSCRLTFPFPDDEARERLWRVHLPSQMPLAGRLDLAGLARRYKMSGGYIRNAALRAAFLAAEEASPLTQDHLERAVRAEFREGGKLAESGMLE
nr:ATP-binding protein [Myxococcota bacterium]